MRKRIKVHPAPPILLDTDKAPWSAPRGYATSIPEEVATYKLGIYQSKVSRPHPNQSPQRVTIKLPRNRRRTYLSKCWTAIKAHFRAVKQDMLPQQTDQDPNGDVRIPPVVACICCLPKI